METVATRDLYCKSVGFPLGLDVVVVVVAVVAVVLKLTRIIKSMVTGQVPVTLEWKNTQGEKKAQNKNKRAYIIPGTWLTQFTPPPENCTKWNRESAYDVLGPYWYIRRTTRASKNSRLHRLPPRKDHHVYVTRGTYRYAYARQTQVNWKKEKTEKKRKKKKRKRNRKGKKKRTDEKTKQGKERMGGATGCGQLTAKSVPRPPSPIPWCQVYEYWRQWPGTPARELCHSPHIFGKESRLDEVFSLQAKHTRVTCGPRPFSRCSVR